MIVVSNSDIFTTGVKFLPHFNKGNTSMFLSNETNERREELVSSNKIINYLYLVFFETFDLTSISHQ